MFLKLTNEQLNWILGGTGFSDSVIALFHDHYVNGMTKFEAAENNGLTKQFANKKWRSFEELIEKRCNENDLVMSVVFHAKKDSKAVFSFDAVSKK